MPRHFTPEDIHLHRHITDVDCNAARKAAICSVEAVDKQGDTYTSAIWLFSLDGSFDPLQLTTGQALDSQACWAPDGQRIAFVSDRSSSKMQVHLISPDGGEARALDWFKHRVNEVVWRPDSKALLVTASVPVDPNAKGEDDDGEGEERDEDAPQVVWRLPYKMDGVGYTLGRQKHLFLLDPERAEVKQLTEGSEDEEAPAWSPDGRQIAYVRTREGAGHCTDIWVMDAEGGNKRRLSRDQPTAASPAWSPDGRYIVFSGATDEGDAQSRLWRIDMPDGTVAALGHDSVEVVMGAALQWLGPDRFAFIQARQGLQEVAAMSVLSGEVETLIGGDRHISVMSCAGDHIVFTAESPVSAEKVYATDARGAGECVLKDFNPWWSEREAPTLERRRFQVPDGEGGSEEIDGCCCRHKDRDQCPCWWMSTAAPRAMCCWPIARIPTGPCFVRWAGASWP